MVFAGCSSSDNKDTATPHTLAPAGTGTTVRPVDTSFTGQNSAQFCTLAKTYSERVAGIGTNPTPAQLRTVVEEGQTAISQVVSAAPGEIKKDVEVLAATLGGLLSELEKVNFEAAKLPPAALSGLTAPEFTASTAHFQAYTRTVCGVS